MPKRNLLSRSYNLKLITEYHPNGQKKYEGHYNGVHPVGDHTSWHKCGNKEYESIELDESTETVTYWHESGQIKSKGNCTNYWKSGSWTEWYENGNKKSEGLYKGKDERSGKWSFWHINGQLACTVTHQPHSSNQFWKFWDESGDKIYEHKYRKIELLDVWKSLRRDGCSDDLISKYQQCL